MKYRLLVWQLRAVKMGLLILRRYARYLRFRYHRYLAELDAIQ